MKPKWLLFANTGVIKSTFSKLDLLKPHELSKFMLILESAEKQLVRKGTAGTQSPKGSLMPKAANLVCHEEQTSFRTALQFCRY